MDNSSTLVSKEVVDYPRLKALFGDDDVTIKELLNIFIITTKPLLSKIEEAIHAADFSEARALGHQVAGSAANMGIQRVHFLARELEHAADGQAVHQCQASLAAMQAAFADVLISVHPPG
jgi:HPt (histidine-containing phosphotransfer) domain-containing protein